VAVSLPRLNVSVRVMGTRYEESQPVAVSLPRLNQPLRLPRLNRLLHLPRPLRPPLPQRLPFLR